MASLDLTLPIIEAICAALKAGSEILKIYDSAFEVEAKSDNSPLTRADSRSDEVIRTTLMRYGIPMISEEGRDLPYEERKSWEQLWIIDPLDGTKEFVKRNGEFTVNIALIEKQMPILGVVYAPVPRLLYFAANTIGSFKMSHITEAWMNNLSDKDSKEVLNKLTFSAQKLPCTRPHTGKYTVVGSRSHAGTELTRFVELISREKDTVDFVQIGSSLKICMVAEGLADIYPRLGPTMEWDTAAGHAVAKFSGASVYDFQTKDELVYNKADLLNPWFVVQR